MNFIFSENEKKGSKSVAFSTKSSLSSMRPGAFFKVVDSPFKLNMMQCLEKMQNVA